MAGEGDDRTVLLPMRGLRVDLDIRVFSRLKASREVVERVMVKVRELRRASPGPVLVAIDGGGLGGGPAGDLQHIASEEPDVLAVIPRQFGGAGDGEYHSEAAWMWGKLRDMIDTMQLPCDADLLAEEISNRHYDTERGRIRIEPKAKYKERHQQSPDLADALVLACSLYGWEPQVVLRVPSTFAREEARI